MSVLAGRSVWRSIGSIVPNVLRWRRGGASILAVLAVDATARADATATRVEGHVLHPLAHGAHLELAQPLLEELQIPPPLVDLGVELGDDGVILGAVAHGNGSLDQSLFSLDLLVDVEHFLLVGHGGGVDSVRLSAQKQIRKGRRGDATKIKKRKNLGRRCGPDSAQLKARKCNFGGD
ncbi:hypothetical protein VTK73DRAFT_4682 [Phialemonium thermophilum]|uniref:Secreted protein n=1 Tax=Phialemonium thermophilum TaxID=223376 RepID=A0ABR3WS08_9PEZI